MQYIEEEQKSTGVKNVHEVRLVGFLLTSFVENIKLGRLQM